VLLKGPPMPRVDVATNAAPAHILRTRWLSASFFEADTPFALPPFEDGAGQWLSSKSPDWKPAPEFTRAVLALFAHPAQPSLPSARVTRGLRTCRIGPCVARRQAGHRCFGFRSQ